MTNFNSQALEATLVNALVAVGDEPFMVLSPRAMEQVEIFAATLAEQYGVDENELNDLDRATVEAVVAIMTPEQMTGTLVDNVLQPMDETMFEHAITQIKNVPDVAGRSMAFNINLVARLVKAHPRLKMKAQ